jgi:hypothetical protein
MSQEALRSLLGWILIVTAIWMTCLAIGQVVLFGHQLSSTIRTLSGRRLDKITQKFSDEEDRISDEVEPKFALWWNEVGKSIVERSPGLYANIGLSDEVGEVTEQLRAIMKGVALHMVSRSAQEFAVHLASKPSHDIFIAEIRHIDSKRADAYLERYEKHLDDHRRQLADLGINVGEFEALFSAT